MPPCIVCRRISTRFVESSVRQAQLWPDEGAPLRNANWVTAGLFAQSALTTRWREPVAGSP